MAAPQTERGFVMIACDLFAALSVADWPKREWTVLAEILLQVYGPQKRREAHLDPRLIEHYSGLSSKNVYRALKSLKACGVVSENANGSYRFVKDFESWDYEAIEKATGSPNRTRRLTDGDLRFALSATDRYGVVAPINKSKAVGIQPDTNGIQRDTVSGHERYPTGYQNCAPTVSNGIPATIGTRPSEEFENLDIVDGDSREATEPDRIRSPEHRATVDLARELFGDVFAETVTQMGRDIEQSLGGRWDCYRAAMSRVKKARKTNIDNLHAYCIRTGGQYAATSIPPEPVAFKPESAAKPIEFTTAPEGFAEHISGKKGTK